MAYDTTYAYINCPGSSSDNLCNGPHLAGAVRFAASRETVNDPSVTITCKVWLGFGSYGTTTESFTSNSVQARCWVGTGTYDDTASAQKDSVTINSAGTTWKCTSNSLTRLTTTYSCLTQTAKPTHKSNTDDLQMTVSNWTSGSKTMSFRLWHNGSTSTTTKKTVSLAAPEYHANVTVTLNANGGTIDTNSAWTGSGTTVTKSVVYGEAIGNLPWASMSRSGYNRRRYDPDSSGNATDNTCWYTTQTGNTMVASTKTYTAASTIYAQWYTNGTGSISASPTSTTYGGSTTITYSRAGGENNAISS